MGHQHRAENNTNPVEFRYYPKDPVIKVKYLTGGNPDLKIFYSNCDEWQRIEDYCVVWFYPSYLLCFSIATI